MKNVYMHKKYVIIWSKFSTFLVTEVITEGRMKHLCPTLLSCHQGSRNHLLFSAIFFQLLLFFYGLPQGINSYKEHFVVNVSASRNTLLNRMNKRIWSFLWSLALMERRNQKGAVLPALELDILAALWPRWNTWTFSQMKAERIAKFCK